MNTYLYPRQILGKLWGRYLPARADDETTYPMVLNGWAIVDLGTLTYTFNGNSFTTNQLQTSIKAPINNSTKVNAIAPSYDVEIASGGAQVLTDMWICANQAGTFFVKNTQYTDAATFKAAMAGVPLLYELATSDGSVWKFVKDTGFDGTGTDLGYYNEATDVFVKVHGATGSVITKVEYLESTGTQYIDTGYTMSSDNVEYGIVTIGAQQSASSLFGSETNNAGVKYSGVPYSTKAIPYIGSTSYLTLGGLFSSINENNYILKSDGVTISTILNGVTRQVTASQTIQKTLPIFLFANNRFGVAGQFASIKVKHFYIKDSGAIVRDFLPVRIGTIGYMFDLVEWKLYANSGTGAFSYGTDIPPAMETRRYLSAKSVNGETHFYASIKNV